MFELNLSTRFTLPSEKIRKLKIKALFLLAKMFTDRIYYNNIVINHRTYPMV